MSVSLSADAAQATNWVLSGQSEALHRLLDRCEAAARSTLPVLIEGEEGTAHETIARHIHALSQAKANAFTSLRLPGPAKKRKTGGAAPILAGPGQPLLDRLMAAGTGTLFLHDIADLDETGQRSLAAFLTNALRERAPNRIRLMAATSRDIVAETREGRFLAGLHFAIGIMPVRLPPLRERCEDIPALATALRREMTLGGTCCPPASAGHPFGGAVLAALQSLRWPRNFEEFADAIRESARKAGAGPIEPRHLSSWLKRAPKSEIHERPAALSSAIPPLVDASAPPARQSKPKPFSGFDRTPVIQAFDPSGKIRSLGEVEAEHIRIAFAFYNGRASDMARHLGIGRSTLYRKVRALGLDRKATVVTPKGTLKIGLKLGPLH